MTHDMSADYALRLYKEFEALGCPVWIDGGWAVDALLGEQTRAHSDLDIALEDRFTMTLRENLISMGYRDVERDDTTKWNFVLGDASGHEVDFHTFVLDDSGNVTEGTPYPKGSLTGIGRIKGIEVRTIDPQQLVKFHSGYELKEKDYKDVKALCEKYGLQLPDGYRHFEGSDGLFVIRTRSIR
jgi:lincosamide nucleotidyltransferase A/C/D/E